MEGFEFEHDCVGWKGASSDWNPQDYNEKQWAELETIRKRFDGLIGRLAKVWSVTQRAFKDIGKSEKAHEFVREYVAELSQDLVPSEWIERSDFQGHYETTYNGLHVPLSVTPMHEPDPEIARLIAHDRQECTEDISYWTITGQYGTPYGKAVAIKFLVERGYDGIFGRTHGPRGLLVIVCREAPDD